MDEGDKNGKSGGGGRAAGCRRRPRARGGGQRGCRLFFFFQAEDGIRDYKVTGVQTCALPILIGAVFAAGSSYDRLVGIALSLDRNDFAALDAWALARSEERRVGKEGRSRWSPYH